MQSRDDVAELKTAELMRQTRREHADEAMARKRFIRDGGEGNRHDRRRAEASRRKELKRRAA